MPKIVSTPLRIRDLAIAWPVLSVSALLIRNFPFQAVVFRAASGSEGLPFQVPAVLAPLSHRVAALNPDYGPGNVPRVLPAFAVPHPRPVYRTGRRQPEKRRVHTTLISDRAIFAPAPRVTRFTGSAEHDRAGAPQTRF